MGGQTSFRNEKFLTSSGAYYQATDEEYVIFMAGDEGNLKRLIIQNRGPHSVLIYISWD